MRSETSPNLDALFYRYLATELNSRLVGLELRGIEDPNIKGRTPEGMLLRFAGETGGLFVSLDRDCPGSFWTRSVGGTRSVRGIPQRLFAKLKGAKVVSVVQPQLDRILDVGFQSPENGALHLLLEMTGRLGNVLLTDGEGIILVVARAVFAGMSRVRRLEAGLPYVPPPLPPARSSANTEGLRKSAIAENFNAAAEAAYLERERTLATRGKRGMLLARLHAKLEQQSRLLGHLQDELAEARKNLGARMEADHLAAYLATIPKGQTEAVFSRFDGQGEIRIQLNPALSPKESLDRLFKKARKAEKNNAALDLRCSDIRKELEQLRKLEAPLQASQEWPELLLLEEQLPPESARRAETQARKLPAGVAAFQSSDGLTLLVGKTAQGNATATFALARPRDLWFHTRDYPGSHVLLLRQGKKDPPHRSILEAAALAAHFSKAANQPMVDVAFCLRYQVRAPRGAAPGKVQYSGEKTLSIRLEPALIEPLLRRRMSMESE